MAIELLNRIIAIEKKEPFLAEGLHTAFTLLEKDSQLSLAKARIILERVLRMIYNKETLLSGQSMDIGTLLKEDVINTKVPPRILSRMHTIRSLGNLAIHDQKIIRQDVESGLDNLLHVLEWYDSTFNQLPQHQESEHNNQLFYIKLLSVLILGVLLLYFLFTKNRPVHSNNMEDGSYEILLITEETDSVPYYLRKEFFKLHLTEDQNLNPTIKKFSENGIDTEGVFSITRYDFLPNEKLSLSIVASDSLTFVDISFPYLNAHQDTVAGSFTTNQANSKGKAFLYK